MDTHNLKTFGQLVSIAAEAVWDDIASDVLDCVEDNQLNRDHVIELVLDCDRVYLKLLELNPKLKEVAEAFQNMRYEDAKALLRKTFTDEVYGL